MLPKLWRLVFRSRGDFCIANQLVFASAITGQHEVWKAQVTNEGTLVNYQQLTNGPASQPVDNPRWSSDGNWIIFQRDGTPDPAADAVTWQLFAVRSDGTAWRALGIAGIEPLLLGGGWCQERTCRLLILVNRRLDQV